MPKSSERIVATAAEETALRRILSDQLLRYPRFEVRDLYKLIYQAAMGSEHAAQDIVAAHKRLQRELNGLAEGPEEPIVDPISPDGGIVRINLRPYIAGGGDPSALVVAFIRTANEYKGTRANLRRYWSYAERMAEAQQLPFAPSALGGFFANMEAERFPAVHHSQVYRAAYHPAYRVIVHKFLA